MTDAPLTKRQEAFAQAYTRLRVGTTAAIEAGYSVKGASVQASQLLAIPKVLARVKELADQRREQLEALVLSHAEKAVNTLEAVMDSTDSRGGIAKVSAATAILDRSGLKPIERIEQKLAANVQVVISPDDAKL